MARFARSVLALCACLLPAAAGAVEPDVAAPRPPQDAVPANPDPDGLGAAWSRQLAGFDALEAYQLDLDGLGIPVVFGVARRWVTESQVDLLVFVKEPVQMDEVAYLWNRSLREGDGVFTYYTPQLVNFAGSVAEMRARRVARFPLPRLSSGTVESMSLGSFLPYLPGELHFRMLGLGEAFDEPVFHLEARPRDGRDLGFSRLELWLSQRTGVALREVYYDGLIEMRRIEAQPADVRENHGRWQAEKRTIRTADGGVAQLTLRQQQNDRVFDQRLFTRETLRLHRFPDF